MKKITLLFLFLVTVGFVKGQSIDHKYRYDLNFVDNLDNAGCNPFLLKKESLNVEAGYFKVSHGSPDFIDDNWHSAVKLKASRFDQVEKSEGLFTNIETAGFSIFTEFKKGYVYRVGLINYLDTRSTGKITARIYMADGLSETKDSSCTNKKVPSINEKVKIFEDSRFDYTYEQDKFGSKFQPKEDYSQLWILSIYDYFVSGYDGFYFKEILIEDYGKDTEPPDPPSNLQFSERTTNSFKLTWNEPDDNYNGVDYYKVYIDNSLKKENISSTSVTINVDDDCHTYSVEVTAVDVAGNESTASNIDVTTAFNEPPLTINGSNNALCSGSFADFSTDYYEDVAYNWSAGNGLNLNDNHNHETSVTANNNYNGESYIEINRTFDKDCPNGDTSSELSRVIWVGSPQFSLSGMDELYTYDMGTVIVDYGLGSGLTHTDQGSPTMDWSFTGPLISITGDYRKADYTSGHHTGQGWIYGESTNQCGSTTEDFYYEVIDGGFMMTLSPVPADDQLTVTVENSSKTETTAQTTQTEEYEYYLYNDRYQLVKQKKVQGNRFQINTNDLSEGFYFLNVVSGEKVWKKKLEIRH